MIEVSRESAETRIRLRLELRGTGSLEGRTGLPFFDHMLEQLVFHSGIDLEVEAEWDLAHHLMEDLLFLLGRAISKGLGDRRGIARFGWSAIPMDESLIMTSVDLGGRVHFSCDLKGGQVEGLAVDDLMHGIEALARGSLATIHVVAIRAGNLHHAVEATYKSLALSLAQAMGPSPGLRSTKGVVDIEG